MVCSFSPIYLFILLTIFFIAHMIFIFKILFIFNWMIIALQYCVDFCNTSTWISHRYTYISSLLKIPPTSYPILPFQIVTKHWFVYLNHTANSHWLSILHVVAYIFPCYSFHLSHPLLPPLWPVCWAEMEIQM